VQVKEGEHIVFDIKYATTDNFMHEVLYSDSTVYLHKDASKLLSEATQRLAQYNKEHNTHYKIKIWDAFRKFSIQIAMYNKVKHTPQHIYVSDPHNGEAAHTRGVAIDLTLVDKNKNELDMGTEFDNFSEKAHRDAFEQKLITKEQENNRQLLNFVMGKQFIGYSKEWWHYNIEMTDENKVKYPKITDL